MRCLGRIVLLILILGFVAIGWLYRDDLGRWIDRTLHPGAAAARIGHPSAAAYAAAMRALSTMQDQRQDSIMLNANEMASLVSRGVRFLPGVALDSMSLELEDRGARIRTVVDSARIPDHLRAVLPGHRAFEEVVVRGPITAVHAG